MTNINFILLGEGCVSNDRPIVTHVLPEVLRSFPTIHIRHVAVHDDCLVLGTAILFDQVVDSVDGLHPIACLFNAVACVFENEFQRVSDHVGVIYEEDIGTCAGLEACEHLGDFGYAGDSLLEPWD